MHLATDWCAPEQIDRLVAEYRAVVDHVWLFGVTGPYYGDNEPPLPYYRGAQRLGLPVLFHTGSVPAPDSAVPGQGVSLDYHPLELERIVRARPDLPLVALHGGSFFWREALIAAHSSPNVYLALGDFDSSAGMCVDNLASWDLAGALAGSRAGRA